MEINKGQILDIYPEGGMSFRACVLGDNSNGVRVVNLITGEITHVRDFECGECLIHDILKLD